MAKSVKQPKPASTRWDASHGTYIAGRGALDGVDALAVAMERRWGAGRLRLLVDRELREKFDRQRYLLAAAVQHGDLEEVRKQASRMEAGWRVLDRAATEAGVDILAPLVWEVALADGTVAALVYDAADAAIVQPDERTLVVYSLDEIGRIIDLHRASEGHRPPRQPVERIARTLPDPLDAIAQAGDFDDPLDTPGITGAG